MSEELNNDGKTIARDSNGRLKKGSVLNPKGMEKGTKKEKSFIEFYNEIAEDIAIKNNISVDEFKKSVYMIGIKNAQKGDYRFYKDILDRIHGQAKQSIDLEEKTKSGNVYNIFFSKEIQAEIQIMENRIKKMLVQKPQ